jgi:predicted nucleic acid-binding protein
MTERVPIYDSGMLIALVDRKAKALYLHKALESTNHRAVVLGSVLAQVWRPHPATVHAFAHILKGCTIPQARSAAPALRATTVGQATGLTCASAPDLTDWQRIGTVLGTAALPPKKRPDTVDALVALTAARHGNAVVFTSDPADLTAYLDAMGARDVHTIPV